MSKYTITMACGHEEVHNIVGTNVHGEREKKAEWLSTRLCYECYKKQQAEEAAKATADANLPELTGSEKQIAWATDIRAKAAPVIAAMQARIKEHAKKSPNQTAAMQIVLDELRAQTSAKWWIDNRDVAINDVWLVKKAQEKM